jgi:hypothetical protein
VAHRPIANPTIVHSMATPAPKTTVKKGIDNRNMVEKLEIILGRTRQEMRVDYNCVFPGRTLVTVTIPLLPRGSVSWTWIKVCDGDTEFDLGDQYGEFTSDPDYDGDDDSDIGTDANKAQVGSSDDPNLDDDEDYWSEWDERSAGFHADDVPDNQVATSPPQRTLFVNIGQPPGAADGVFARGGVTPAYAMPAKSGARVDVSASPFQVVHNNVDAVTFSLSVPFAQQEYGIPSVISGDKHVQPKLTGNAMYGGSVKATDKTPPSLTLTFNCARGWHGTTSVLVVLPLLPRSLAKNESFRVIKVCGKFQARVEPTMMTAPNIMLFFALVVGGLILYVVWKAAQLKGSVSYAAVRRYDEDADDVGGVDDFGTQHATAFDDDDDELSGDGAGF